MPTPNSGHWDMEPLIPLHPRERKLSEIPPNPQLQSPFVSKLPMELKLRIFELVLGRWKLFHIRTVDSKLRSDFGHLRRHYCHEGDDVETWYHSCWHNCEEEYQIRRPRDPVESLLGLPLSCRALYLESIDVLYAKNHFHIAHGSLNQMQLHTLPYRLAAIRSLKWHAVRDYTLRRDNLPTSLATVLSWLPGLQELRIYLAHFHVDAMKCYNTTNAPSFYSRDWSWCSKPQHMFLTQIRDVGKNRNLDLFHIYVQGLPPGTKVPDLDIGNTRIFPCDEAKISTQETCPTCGMNCRVRMPLSGAHRQELLDRMAKLDLT